MPPAVQLARQVLNPAGPHAVETDLAGVQMLAERIRPSARSHGVMNLIRTLATLRVHGVRALVEAMRPRRNSRARTFALCSSGRTPAAV